MLFNDIRYEISPQILFSEEFDDLLLSEEKIQFDKIVKLNIGYEEFIRKIVFHSKAFRAKNSIKSNLGSGASARVFELGNEKILRIGEHFSPTDPTLNYYKLASKFLSNPYFPNIHSAKIYELPLGPNFPTTYRSTFISVITMEKLYHVEALLRGSAYENVWVPILKNSGLCGITSKLMKDLEERDFEYAELVDKYNQSGSQKDMIAIVNYLLMVLLTIADQYISGSAPVQNNKFKGMWRANRDREFGDFVSADRTPVCIKKGTLTKQLVQALAAMKKLYERTNTYIAVDLHTDNVMVRKSGGSYQLVFSDPFV